MFDKIIAKTTGHILIKDAITGEILVDKQNAIHYENLSIRYCIISCTQDDGWILEMHFGNGGATVNGVGVVSYLPPNTIGQNANLYNPTYYKVINDLSPLNTNPDKNFIEILHTNNEVFTDIRMTVTLDFGEPGDQAAFDNSSSTEDVYVFDELGIKASAGVDAAAGTGLLLTHVIFHPTLKSLNRIIEIIYTIRIAMC
ncbi:MAG: hypothetical protein HC836_10810 [Richelia sp. RM2_1_2]|nr:hypothetical protein [Richelia sp. RM2_1_2]